MSRQRICGFRFSVSDGVFIVLLICLFWYVYDSAGTYVWIIPMAAGHFLLFCNIFRVRRSYELIWTGIFLINVLGWHYSGDLNWLYLLLIQIPVSCLAIGAEMRSERYHGVACRRLNVEHIEKWISGEIK